jgi:eukaryotic-like serine/threonine-protein kinase
MICYPLYCDNCGEINRPEAKFCYRCGEGLHPGFSYTGQLLPDHLLKQRYRILSRLGQGGMGAVYKAEDCEFHRVVAVKEMSQRGLIPDELRTATEAFRHEAEMLASLQHFSLPRIFEYFVDEGRWYLVMDFIEGETLEQYLSKIQGGRLPVEEVLDIGIKLCTVLDYLHTRESPIIFRDLKPSNIMLTAEKHLYLIDFGIARHFKPGQTRDTLVLGSPGYAAPEQHGNVQTTIKADIYSLGATLHQLLSGQDPARTPFRFAPLQMHRHPVLASLETLIMQMVELDQQKRPESMAVVRERLQHIAEQLQHGKHSGYSQASQTKGRSTVLVQASSTGAVASQTGETLYIYRGHSSSVEALDWSPDSAALVSGSSDAIHIWNTLDGKKIYPDQRHFNLMALAWSPDGRYIASASKDEMVQVWEAATGAVRLKHRGHADRVNAVAWSPDGSRIASAGGSFIRNQHIVQIWDADEDRSALTYHGHKDAVFSVAWSPDGTHIVSASKDRTVQVWDAAIGTQFVTYRGHTEPVKTVAWSPDSQFIASGSVDTTVRIWEPLTGNLIYCFKGHTQKVNSLAWSPDSQYVASASEDGTVQVWAVNGTLVFTYRGHNGPVNAIAWSPDGAYLASASKDRTVQVWAALASQ